jgi:SAM-dependent methyltransferase
MTDFADHNRKAWDRERKLGNPATIPYSLETIEAAKCGRISLSLTGRRTIPESWYPPLAGARVICVALGGGQQVPLLAAAGAHVLSLDNSPAQLAADEDTARRSNLSIETALGDMTHLGAFSQRSFDLAVVGLGTQFVEDPGEIWRGLAGVVRPQGRLLCAFVNPVQYLFRWPEYSEGILHVAHALPYSDLTSLTAHERSARFHPEDPIEFGHTLEQTLGGLMCSGFSVDGFLEDRAEGDPLAPYMANYYAIGALRR